MPDAIGPIPFVRVSGTLPRIAPTFQNITLFGEDGDTYRETGNHSEEATLFCMLDPVSDVQADALVDSIRMSLVRGQWRITQFNRLQNGLFLVLSVAEVPFSRQVFTNASGGIYEGNEKLELAVTVVKASD